MIGLYFEEIDIGLKVGLGTYLFTSDRAEAFIRTFVPVGFHVDRELAEQGLFKRPAVAGWHTACAWMSCYVATNTQAIAAISAAGGIPAEAGPSPGFTELRWPKPVHIGDSVTYSTCVTGKREMKSRPEWGLVHAHNEGHNQHGEHVFSFESKVLTRRR